jgi:O-antigen ligase
MLDTRSTPFPLRYATLAIATGWIGALTLAVTPSPRPMLVLLAISVLFVVMQHPAIRRIEFAFLSIVILCSTIIDIDTLPLIPIGIGSLNPADGILAVLGVIVVGRWLFDPTFKGVGSRLTAALTVFFMLAVLSVVNALVTEAGSRHRVLSELRTLAFLLLIVIVPQYIRTQHQLRFLMRGLTLLAVACAIIMLAQAFLGPDVELIPRELVSVNEEVYAETGLFRVTPPAQALIRTMLVLLMTEWMLTPLHQRAKWLVPVMILLGLGLLVTANRNYWIGTAISIGAILILIDPRKRFTALQSGIWTMIVCIGVGIITFLIFEMMQVRFASQLLETTLLRLDPDSSVANTESSLGTRQEELYYINRQVEAHPIIGIGLGANYQPLRWYESSDFNRQYYTHNAYLWILMKMGLTGFLAFLWLTIAFLWQSLHRFNTPQGSLEQSVILGAGVLYVGLLFSAPFSPVFLEGFWTPLIGLTMGLSEAALHMEHA